MFRSILLGALLTATPAVVSASTTTSTSSLSKLSASSRQLEDGEQQNAQNENYISWMANYNMIYEYCYHSEKTVSYKLCPLMAYSYEAYGRNSCEVYEEGCATYLADLSVFLDAFTEAQMNGKQYRCEYVRETCEYDNEEMCFQDEDLQYCLQEWNENMNVQGYMECAQISEDYYVGPYCGEDNVGIYLHVFKDADCTKLADDNSAFFNVMGYELPYSSSSLIGAFGTDKEGNTECASCMEFKKEDEQAEGDQYDEDGVLEQCEYIYEYTSRKCEKDLLIDNPDSSACGYIKDLQQLEKVGEGRSGLQKFGLTVMIVGLLTVGVAAAVYHVLEEKKKRGTGSSNGPSNETLI